MESSTGPLPPLPLKSCSPTYVRWLFPPSYQICSALPMVFVSNLSISFANYSNPSGILTSTYEFQFPSTAISHVYVHDFISWYWYTSRYYPIKQSKHIYSTTRFYPWYVDLACTNPLKHAYPDLLIIFLFDLSVAVSKFWQHVYFSNLFYPTIIDFV